MCCGCRFFGRLAERINFNARKTPATRHAAEQANLYAWFRDFFCRTQKKRTPIPTAHRASDRASLDELWFTPPVTAFAKKQTQKTVPGWVRGFEIIFPNPVGAVGKFGVPGQYYDEETGLHYNYFRYYDMEGSRYLRRDPISFGGINVLSGGQISRIGIQNALSFHDNMYVFADNRPTKLIDPYGLFEIPAQFYGELIAKLVEEFVPNTYGSLTGLACASRLCKREVTPGKDWFFYLSECFSVHDKMKIPYGGLGGSDSIVSACADRCEEIVESDSYKEECLCKKKEN